MSQRFQRQFPTFRQDVLSDVAHERARQDERWGPEATAHDDAMRLHEWWRKRAEFEEWVSSDADWSMPGSRRAALITIAALAVAQVEAMDRRRRRGVAQEEEDARSTHGR